MASKSAAATAAAPPQDPIDAEIARCRQAIAETQKSPDPAYIARPWKRDELIDEIEARIHALEGQKVAQALAAEEKAIRQKREAAWSDLEPQRRELASRWNDLRQQIRTLLADARRLDAVHIERCNRRGLSEAVVPMSLLSARCDVNDGSPVLLRPVSDL